uniref:Uncharacterized protein n=1 Tax=Rhizophora mucronata TaxID=61149 RepID=A0A2P2INE4_RHIMU
MFRKINVPILIHIFCENQKIIPMKVYKLKIWIELKVTFLWVSNNRSTYFLWRY